MCESLQPRAYSLQRSAGRIFAVGCWLSAVGLLSGCLAQSKVQGKYMESQEGCRNETARSVAGGETSRPVSENQVSPIAQRFSDCMTKEGWHLATPKPGGTVVVSNPPTGSPSTNPHAALSARPSYPPASAYPAESSYPANTNYQSPAASTAVRAATPVVAAPASVTAAPLPAARVVPQTTIPTSPDVMTYQPGRPWDEVAPPYGTGPGRQF